MPRRGENIRKRKDGRWEGRYIKGYDSKTKRAKYVSIYGKTYTETKQKLNEAKYKTNAGLVYIDAKNKMLGEVILRWFENQKLNLKPSSVNKYQNLIENHIMPELGHIKLHDLSADTFYTFLNSQQKNGNKKNGGMLSVSTLQTMLYILNSVIRYASSRNLIAFFSIHLPNTINIDTGITPIQTLNQNEEKLLDAYLSLHISYRNLGIMLSLYCGLRIGEICALKWTDIDCENSVLYVKRTVQRIATPNREKRTVLHVGTPKSKSSIRFIPIPSFLIPIIFDMGRGQVLDSYILTGSVNVPLDPRTFQYYYKKILSDVGIEYHKYHTLRHTFATNCVALGFDTKSLSEILGHSNVGITLNKYVHPSMHQKKIQMDYWNFIKGQIYGQAS